MQETSLATQFSDKICGVGRIPGREFEKHTLTLAVMGPHRGLDSPLTLIPAQLLGETERAPIDEASLGVSLDTEALTSTNTIAILRDTFFCPHPTWVADCLHPGK
jgi:hypothetical protein